MSRRELERRGCEGGAEESAAVHVIGSFLHGCHTKRGRGKWGNEGGRDFEMEMDGGA